MFCTSQKDSELRLIDFGSGTLDYHERSISNAEHVQKNHSDADNDDVERHHTFAGSAFYISPEMFQRTYTSKTDVWSAGATLYVLVAGYPADRLQETFNILQTSTTNQCSKKPGGRLRKLPNLPNNLPDSYYEMLEGALTYRHKSRLSAGLLLKGEFPQFHLHHAENDQGSGTISIHDVVAEAARESEDGNSQLQRPSLNRTKSVLLEGSVNRHSEYLGYQRFERSVTTLLATMLPKEACHRLLVLLKEHHKEEESSEKKYMENASTDKINNAGASEEKVARSEEAVDVDNKRRLSIESENANKLQVVTIKVLIRLLSVLNIEQAREV